MKKCVLVVEDKPDIRMMMKILIQSHGYDVVEARDGTEAIEQATECEPDLILMDLMMPIMDGFTATRIIRENAALKDVPILAVTAYGKTYLDKALEVGFDAVISKPVDFANLDQLLKKYCDGDRSNGFAAV
jgi:two-component system, cell cycle response regulator DivK